jgi:hypothetical protein
MGIWWSTASAARLIGDAKHGGSGQSRICLRPTMIATVTIAKRLGEPNLTRCYFLRACGFSTRFSQRSSFGGEFMPKLSYVMVRTALILPAPAAPRLPLRQSGGGFRSAVAWRLHKPRRASSSAGDHRGCGVLRGLISGNLSVRPPNGDEAPDAL